MTTLLTAVPKRTTALLFLYILHTDVTLIERTWNIICNALKAGFAKSVNRWIRQICKSFLRVNLVIFDGMSLPPFLKIIWQCYILLQEVYTCGRTFLWLNHSPILLSSNVYIPFDQLRHKWNYILVPNSRF